MKSKDTFNRIEKDSLGEIRVPKTMHYGAQTQRAVDNFPISGLKMPRAFIHALAFIKYAAAKVNADLKLLPDTTAKAIMQASLKVAKGTEDAHLPVDVFQTGSGTSTNMNANEVIAHLANEKLKGKKVHPNDQVNMGQSSNDVIPAAIHLSVSMQIQSKLLPALKDLQSALEKKAKANKDIVKTGRTHLMDALPLTFGQEMGGWAAQISDNIERIQNILPRIHQICLGGTAIGTGLNTHPEFGKRVVKTLSQMTGLRLTQSKNLFAAISSQDTAVELAGLLNVCAVSLTKICNDLRWMNSGPLAGLAEISLQAIQPGSSIMPGKVNPVIPEAILMANAQVIGNTATVTQAGSSGNFQLNVMLPVIAYNLLQSIQLVTNSAKLLNKAVTNFKVNVAHIELQLSKNPILVTALNPIIGYEKAAEIAKKAYKEHRPILDVALEMTDIPKADLVRILNPRNLTQGGLIKLPKSKPRTRNTRS